MSEEKYFSRDNLELVIDGLKTKMVPNWNENDSGALGYINNRTHYEEIIELFSIENVEFINGEYINETAFVINVGDTYIVNWDGTEYTCVAYIFEGLPAIGNTSQFGGTGNSEPFAIGYDSAENINFVYSFDDSTTHTFSVVGNLVHTINPKYLPKLVGKNVTGTEYIIDDETVIAELGAEIFNDYIGNKASGYLSHAEGETTTASGSNSHAEGGETTASGGNSHAEGHRTTASGDASHAEGSKTTASGTYSHAEGRQTSVTDSDSITATITNTSLKGYAGHAEGYGTVSYGRCSHAEGNGTTASGSDSHAEGNGTIASGNHSHAEGYGTNASGKYSHAEGGGTTASDIYSHAEGSLTTASGSYSHAEGSLTTASGTCSHAEGSHTIAQRKYQHVQGSYNIADTGGSGVNTYGNYVHIVGNGESNDARSNAHTLDWNGNAWFAGDIYVGGTGQYDASATKLLKENDLSCMTFKNYHGMPIEGWWRNMAYGNGVSVAVNYAANATISAVYSYDGLVWNKSNLPTICGVRWMCVAYGNGMFVATSNTERAAYSTDGINWIETTMPKSLLWSSVTYGNEMFVAVSSGVDNTKSNVAAYSTDGITWTQTTMPRSSQWVNVCYGNDKFMAVSQATGFSWGAYSTDGITWTDTKIATNIVLYRVIYANNMFVASGSGSKIYYSTDGISWSYVSNGYGGILSWMALTYGDGKFITISPQGIHTVILCSTDGITWETAAEIEGLPNNTWCDVQYIDNKFIAIGKNTDYIMYSTDAVNWNIFERKQIVQNYEDITDKAIEALAHTHDEYISSPATATVGQTIRVSAVDENGVPTAWEAFDPFVLTDESTGIKYKLTVVDSKLTMTEVTV